MTYFLKKIRHILSNFKEDKESKSADELYYYLYKRRSEKHRNKAF